MSKRGRKSDYAILATLGTITVLVILGFVSAGLLEEDDEVGRFIRTSRSAKPEGILACYMLYERIGWQGERLEKSLMEEHLVGVEVLFMIEPVFQIQAHEARALKQWIAGGGVLVCSRDVETRIQQGLSQEEGEGRRRSRYSRSVPVWDSSDYPNATSVPDVSADLPLARDVTEALFTTISTIDADEPKDETTANRLTGLFADTTGCRIAERKIGKGRAIVLADTSFLANKRLARCDNSVLATNLAAYSLVGSSSGTIVFDEYHFGCGGRESGWTAISAAVFKTSPGWAVLVVAASGLCLLIYKGRRFGTRVSPGRARRRSKLEYVHSVGATYRAAGANRLAFQLIYTSLLNNAAKLVGLPESASPLQIAERLATRTGTSPRKYESSFEMCQKALQARRMSGRRFATLLERLAGIESEMMNGHSEGKRTVASGARRAS
jgi:hypothetical protein